MTYMRRPAVQHSSQRANALGLTERDYEGRISTLCAGCGHDAISAAIVRTCFELAIEPHRLAKFSGIGCSSKTPAYFLGGSHGINAVHGRMPSVVTGANAANPHLYCLGVSGDGDTLSIGLGQFVHAIRRDLNMVYIIENNGVYGLTKGQFSASADVGSRLKKGEENRQSPIDPVSLALTLGCGFVARSFSGDKGQLVPLIQAGLEHPGFAVLDVISPCVTFNDHPGSTKSYAYTREHLHAVTEPDFVPQARPIHVEQAQGSSHTVRLHDGTELVLYKLDDDYDVADRCAALSYLQARQATGEVVTGLLHVEPRPPTGDGDGTPSRALSELEATGLHPGSEGLKAIQAAYR